MDDDNQDMPAALREIAAEMRRIRQTLLIGIAVLCFIAGLLMLCYPHYLVPMVACFVASAALLPREARAWLAGVGVALVTGTIVAGYWKIRVRKDLLITLTAVHCTLPLSAEVSPPSQSQPEASEVAAQLVPEIDRLSAALGSALVSLEPPVKFTRESATTLRVSHREQTFRIHDRFMDGRIATEARETAARG
jgi:hypothetical protein